MQDCARWMEFDLWQFKSGDTSPAMSGSFKPLAGFPVGNDVLRDVYVARVWGFADVYRLLFDTRGLGVVAGLLSQDRPLASATAAFDGWGTRSPRFLLDAGAHPTHHFVVLPLPLLLQKDRPLLIHRPRQTLPTSPLFWDSAFDNVETRRVTPASAIVTGDGQTAVFVSKAANAVDGLGG